MSVLTLENVSKKFGKYEIFKDISVKLDFNQVLVVFGPNASGKSTLLRIMGTLDRPTGGTVTINGRSLSNLSRNELASLRRSFIGFSFQEPRFIETLSLLDNLLLPLIPVIEQNNLKKFKEKIVSVLHNLNLDSKINFKPFQLSGGERKRADLARALILEPKLLLVDEPTTFADPNSVELIIKTLTEYRSKEDAALVLTTTHDERILSMATKKLNILEYK
ncbi:MAG: ABC transporter ATP-binding protein [Thermoproteota archaeon]